MFLFLMLKMSHSHSTEELYNCLCYEQLMLPKCNIFPFIFNHIFWFTKLCPANNFFFFLNIIEQFSEATLSRWMFSVPLIYVNVLHNLFFCSSYILLFLMAVWILPLCGRLDQAILVFVCSVSINKKPFFFFFFLTKKIKIKIKCCGWCVWHLYA